MHICQDNFLLSVIQKSRYVMQSFFSKPICLLLGAWQLFTFSVYHISSGKSIHINSKYYKIDSTSCCSNIALNVDKILFPFYSTSNIGFQGGINSLEVRNLRLNFLQRNIKIEKED